MSANSVSFGKIFMSALAAGFVSAAINSGLFFIFHEMDIISGDILIPPDDLPMTAIPIIIASLVPSILSTLIYYPMVKFTSNSFRKFRILALILLFISFVNPFMGIPEVPISYAVALNLLHVIVAVSLLFFYGKYARPRENNS